VPYWLKGFKHQRNEIMSKLLYIQASPRAERSHSRAVADEFVKVYQAANPADEIDTIDLFTKELPPFDGLAVQAKYTIMHGKDHSDEEKDAWSKVETVIERFKSADKYVFAVPMWNFGIPYRLKQYIDLIVQPGYTFSVTPEGEYEGLITGKPTLVVYASGGEYSEMPQVDHQKPYMDLLLGFIGLTDTKSISVAPTLMGGPDAAKASRDKAIEEARKLAGDF
jgi:FMN-dependent NADH-azoreductase